MLTPAMSHQTLELHRDGAVARIALARPPANALDLTMARELADVALTCDEDPEIRVVVLSGKGKAFCAGGDLGSFAAAGDRAPALLKEITAGLHVAIARFSRMRPLLIGAVNGVAAGAGLSLVTACDLAIAAQSARFTMAYTRAGLVPDGSSTFFLPRLIGLRRTQELMITNRLLDAAEALSWGLLTRVVPDAELERATGELAREIASGPTGSFAAVKRLLLLSGGDRLESQMEAETREIADAARRHDGREGIAAFLEKRPARFNGL
jgi:2-(1,2-epoxy-1,2-dihydrophenyl)acetyl-CoA isomerase